MKIIQLTEDAIDEHNLPRFLGKTREELLKMIEEDVKSNHFRYIALHDHDHTKCCKYLFCAHPVCCGYRGERDTD